MIEAWEQDLTSTSGSDSGSGMPKNKDESLGGASVETPMPTPPVPELSTPVAEVPPEAAPEKPAGPPPHPSGLSGMAQWNPAQGVLWEAVKSTDPRLVKMAATNSAVYFLLRRNGQVMGGTHTRAVQATEWLQALEAGKEITF